VWVLEQPGLETFFRQGLGIPGHPGQEPDAGLEQRLGGNLAARENEVAKRDFLKLPPSITRSSSPSNRPHNKMTPGPAASSRTRACVRGFPRGER
jgi:hypothetical protein